MIGIHFSHILGTVWISGSPELFKKPITLECLCFPMFWKLYRFLLHPKSLRSLNLCFSPYISRNMGTHFCHILGIFLISASPKIFKKLKILECFCFPMLFPQNGNSIFPCLGKSTHFCFTLSILGNPSLGFFVLFP